MKAVVLNGSPKGDDSVTLQSLRYLAARHDEVEWSVLNVAQKVAVLERDAERWQEVVDEVAGADVVLWCFPVYYLLVPSQYKRFVELIAERGAAGAFAGKYAAALSTSVHFFDHLAHAYIRGISEDLGMAYVGGLSQDMHDLTLAAEREKLLAFGADLLAAVAERRPVPRWTRPLTPVVNDFQPGPRTAPVALGGRRALIVCDTRDGRSALAGMVRRLADTWQGEVEVVNLHDLAIKAGCQGCCHCSLNNECVMEKADEYVAFHRDKVRHTDLLVLAATVVDRQLSSRWRQFFDRSFYANHLPTLSGRQVAWLVAGPLRELPEVREGLTAYVEFQQANLVDIITDEEPTADLDRQLDSLAQRMVTAAEAKLVKPVTFLGVGGHKVLRDEVWGRLRFVFQADHRGFRRLGLYDFPQRDWKTRLTNSVMMAMMRFRGPRRYMRQHMRELMVQQHRKIAEQS